MNKFKNTIFILFCAFQAIAQSASFTINVSSDSVLLGNMIAVTFSLENVEGKDVFFPDFVGFTTKSGPNTSTSMSIMNGQMSQSISYTFYLEPLNVGDAYIEPASINTDEGYLETLPFLVKVYPNPEGIIQQPNTTQNRSSFFGNDPFDNDFFRSNLFNDEFFQGGIIQDLFINPIPLQPDTIITQPKKRKTTRI